MIDYKRYFFTNGNGDLVDEHFGDKRDAFRWGYYLATEHGCVIYVNDAENDEIIGVEWPDY